MVNANLGPDYALAQTVGRMQRQINNLATAPTLLNASTGQTPGTPGLSTDINGLHLFDSNSNENVTLSTADGSANFNGDVTMGGNVTVSGTQTVSGNLTVSGTETVSGNLNVSGTMTASNASITGNLTQTNSYGKLTVGPPTYTNGGPGLVYSKTGTTYGSAAGLGLNTSGGTDYLLLSGPSTTTNGGFLQFGSNLTFELSAQGDGGGPVVECTPGGNGTLTLYGGGSNGSVNLTPYGTGNCQVNGNFAVTGTKAFIMPHPVDSTKMLKHAATESDRNGVEYWGSATTGADGTVTVTLPDYFEALTKATGRNIQLTPTAQCATVPWATPISAGAFTINAPAGTPVDWLVKAERQQIVNGYDVLEFAPVYDAVAFGPQLP